MAARSGSIALYSFRTIFRMIDRPKNLLRHPFLAEGCYRVRSLNIRTLISRKLAGQTGRVYTIEGLLQEKGNPPRRVYLAS